MSLQVSGGFIQWRLGAGTWTNLVALSTLQGEQGIQGVPGTDGTDGLRGTQIFDGEGAPGTVPGAVAGDFYLDTLTGVLYKLS